MKQLIINSLKTKYNNLGLDDKAFDGVAAYLAKTVTKEEDIEAAVAGEDVAALLRAIQGSRDALRNRNAELQRSLDELKNKGGKSEDPDSHKGPDTDKGGAAEALEKLEMRFAALEKSYGDIVARERNSGITKELRRRLEEKGSGCAPVLDLVLGDLEIKDTDTADSLIDGCVASYDATYKRFYGDGPVPPVGRQGNGGYKKGDFAAEVERLKADGRIPQTK